MVNAIECPVSCSYPLGMYKPQLPPMAPAEQMYYHGAPLAHVVLYYEIERERNVLARRQSISGCRSRRGGWQAARLHHLAQVL